MEQNEAGIERGLQTEGGNERITPPPPLLDVFSLSEVRNEIITPSFFVTENGISVEGRRDGENAMGGRGGAVYVLNKKHTHSSPETLISSTPPLRPPQIYIGIKSIYRKSSA